MSEFANDPNSRRLQADSSPNRFIEVAKEVGDVVAIGAVSIMEAPAKIGDIISRARTAIDVGSVALHLK